MNGFGALVQDYACFINLHLILIIPHDLLIESCVALYFQLPKLNMIMLMQQFIIY